jgi:serine/threonine protein kinase/tetratricopeptide (TPR) repeat protein
VPAPRVLGRYALYDKIAAGGMATVHLGRLLGPVGFARTVAIKRLHPQFAGDPEFASMFLDEARLVARISHPNVVPTLDVVSLEGELFIVMEYVRGESLVRLIHAALAAGSPIGAGTVATIMVGVLHGLHAAHEAKNELGQPLGIVHRDVSPQNILVGVDGVPRVLDFGVAKAVGRLQTTREGQLKGKIGYMAPEQIGGQVSRATDVYAASVVLWEALTGHRLFVGDSEAHVLGQVLAGSRVAPSSHVKALPVALDVVTMRGLAVDPADRYPTAREMALALEEAVPLVNASKIGAWVESMAKHTLEQRNERISAIESDSALQAPATLQAPAELSKATVADIPSRRRLLVAQAAPDGRARWPWGVSVLAGLVVVGGILSYRAGTVKSREATSGEARGEAGPEAVASRATASSAAPSATTLADLPPPATKIPEAAGEYAAGMQALHDNSWSLARQHFERTVDLDPTLAVAHLRVAMTTLVLSSAPVLRREEFAKAAALRAQLTPRDLAMLEALEPVLQWVRDDRAEARARLERASLAYPLDVEFLDWLGFMREGDPKGALEPIERAIALDPKDGQAWQTKGHSLALLDRIPEARVAFAGCADLAVDSADCLLSLTRVDALEGKCDAFEADARHMLDRDPMGAFSVAAAMLARGPTATAADMFDQGLAREHDVARRAIIEGHFRTILATLAGDFGRAVELGKRDLAAVAGNATTRSDYGIQLNMTTSLVLALEEAGRDDEVRRVASDFLVQSEGWVPHSFSKGLDTSLLFARLAVGKGGLSPEDFEQRRAAWIEQRLTRSGAYPGLVWTFAYAAPALTPKEARAALAALPKYAPLTPFWLGSPSPDAYAGATYLRAGLAEDAVPYLRRAVANCNGPVEPGVSVRAALDLGLALEARDTSGACAAYKIVLDRWGRATPRSVTADKARKRARALACAR